MYACGTDSKKMYRLCKEQGIYYVDCPVSGGPAGAADSSLSVMIGATEEKIIEQGLEPFLRVIGNTFHYIGKIGGGSSVKIINNYIAFTTQVVNGEALLMADTLGIPTELFYQVTTSSSGSNKILNAKKKKVLTGDLKPGFAPDLVVKDLELARQLCQDMKVPNFTLNTVLQYFLRNYSSRSSSSLSISVCSDRCGYTWEMSGVSVQSGAGAQMPSRIVRFLRSNSELFLPGHLRLPEVSWPGPGHKFPF